MLCIYDSFKPTLSAKLISPWQVTSLTQAHQEWASVIPLTFMGDLPTFHNKPGKTHQNRSTSKLVVGYQDTPKPQHNTMSSTNSE